MDDPIFKSKYQKYKYKVKLWEKNFRKINGRVPSKHDIREAPLNIRDAYKMYYKLKSSFLEDTLNDVLDEDGFELSMDGSDLDGSLANYSGMSLDGSCPLPLPTMGDIGAPAAPMHKSIESLANTTAESSHSSALFSNVNEIGPYALSDVRIGGQAPREFDAAEPLPDDEQFVAQNAKAWGPGLSRPVGAKSSRTEAAPSKSGVISEAVRKDVTEKLFRNASFNKRNPRKSLARNASLLNASGASLLNGSAVVEQLPDLETILMEKAKKQQELEQAQKAAVVAPVIPAAPVLRSVVDQGWLNRCSAVNDLHASGSNHDERQLQARAAAQPVKFGLSNLNVPLIRPSEPVVNKETYAQNTYADDIRDGDDDDDEVIENSEDESSAANSTTNTMRHVLKKRKVHDVRPIVAVKPEPVVEEPVAEKVPVAKTPARKATAAKKKKISSPKLTSTSPKLTATSPTTRRTLRAVRKSTRTTIAKPSTDQADDPLAGDDSDPDFMPPGKPPTNIDDDDKENPRNVEKPKRGPKKASAAQKPAAKVKPTNKSMAVRSDDEAADEEDEQRDYALEFGTRFASSVPRVDVDELLASTKAFQEYVCSDVQTADSPNLAAPLNAAIYVPLTKRELERERFEKKIESGKLNENFVRINIQKKKFSRGHKKVNFSKYKRSEWKKKKVAAALCGPEMDMKGCDGGFLVCFQCGEQGHFASDCKVQADRLLPLDCDEEPSEFPTLDEVERLTAEKAALVNSGRPDSGPAQLKCSANEETADDLEEESSDSGSGDTDENDQSDSVIGADGLQSDIPSAHPLPEEKPLFLGHKIPEEFLKLSGFDEQTVENCESMRPLFDLDANGECIEPTTEVLEALRMFGHTAFRKGQDRAVMRIMSGLPTLVTLSTGSGKSLCYQLPAYMFRQYRKPCITLVISPLVSLMEDQVHDVPGFLNAQCLHTSQSKQVRQRIMDMIKSGVVDVLLVSPEAVVSGEKATGFGSLLRELPPIAFACIDEAHCMSQWSHNFRPSYLMICRVLQEKLKVRTVLGLTATATFPTRESIVQHLAIPDGMRGVISDIPLPNNLLLTVSREENRDRGLVELLRSDKFSEFQSIIVYCTRRDECERVANLIRTCFQDEEKKLRDASEAAHREKHGENAAKKRRRTKSLVEAYHAGLASSRRKKIQTEFMRSDLKIVVATIAFGMGINKADIRAVIHYNMPMTYENYTQEVGRAGRDGQSSHCHLFLDANGKDLVELRRHIYANSIDRHVIRKLLRKVFVPCACEHNLTLKEYKSEIDAAQDMSWTDDMDNESAPAKNKSDVVQAAPVQPHRRKCPGHECSFSIDETIQELDIPEENISTLLCYLELHQQRYIQVLSKAYCRCKVLSYGGPNVLKTAARSCAPLAMAIALDLKRGIRHDTSTLIEFSVIDVASAIGWDSGILKYQLKQLEWTNVNGQPKRSAITIQFSDLGFRIRSPGDLSDDELDETLDLLYNRVTGQERMQLIQLQNVFNGLTEVAFPNYMKAVNMVDEANQHSLKLKEFVRDYFQRSEMDLSLEITNEHVQKDVPDETIISDIRTMISRYPDNQFTGRNLARIFHGVPSPVYPAQIWFRCKYWRVYTAVDFNRIVALANGVIVKMRT